MSSVHSPFWMLESAVWEKLEGIIRDFENALQRNASPSIEEFLLGDGVARLALLSELVQAELEHRLKLRQEARLESYLERFPELRQSPDAVIALIAAERGFRQERDETATWDEYVERFPDYKEQIQRRLASSPEDKAATASTGIPPWTPPPQGKPQSEPMAAAPPAPGDRYQPIQFHVQGGLGEIHLAHDRELNREVALKRIQARHAQNPEVRRRFLVEAEVTARLQHPGVVPVYSLMWDAGGEPTYAMRFIEGESLQEAIDRFHKTDWRTRPAGERNLELRQLLGRFVAVCNTIAYAHSRGILHRDLKPGNIMLGKYGETLIVDWGLARGFERSELERMTGEVTLEPASLSAAETRLGDALGTLPFMSSEQAAGRWDVIGPASDIYSLGATLYSLLCGNPPIQGDNTAEMKEKIIRGDFPSPRQRVADLPKPLEAICLKAMALRPEDRYASPRPLADDIEHWLADQAVSTYAESAGERLARWGRKHQALFGSMVATAFAVLVIGALVAVHLSRESQLTAANNLLQTFDAELERRDWTPAHLETLDSLLANLQTLSRNEAAAARQRLNQNLAASIRESLKLARLEEDEEKRVQAGIYQLEVRDAAAAAELRQIFVQRKGVLKTVIDLKPPYSALQTAFNPNMVCLDKDNQAVLVLHETNPAGPVITVPTAIPCQGNTSIEAQWARGTWGKAQRLGLLLNYTPGHGGPVNSVAFSPDGHYVASAGGDSLAIVWEAASGKLRSILSGHKGGLHCVCFAPDGQTLATAGQDKTVKLWEANSGRLLATLLHARPVRTAVFSADGSTLVTGAHDGAVNMWDVAARTERWTRKEHQGPVSVVRFASDGTLFTASEDRTVKAWDPQTGRVRTTFPGTSSGVDCLACSPDQKILATGDGLGVVKLWDANAARQTGSLEAGPGAVYSVAFTPDSKILITGSQDRTVSLWDVAALKRLDTLRGHTDLVSSVALTGDGKTLASASWDGSVKLWNLDTRQLRTTFQLEYYGFWLSVPQMKGPTALGAAAPASSSSLDTVLRAGGDANLQIVRNGVVLREQAVSLADGPLNLAAARERDRLTFQVNGKPPLFFQELFPVSKTDEGVFALFWPLEGRLEQLHATCLALPGEPSPLERGDLLYARGEFAEALACYQDQARVSVKTQVGAEAFCKEALCHMQLGRFDEAVARFESLAAEPGQSRWAIVAASQLWLLRLRENRREDADEILENLHARYRFDELAKYLSREMRLQILEAYRPANQLTAAYWIRFDPGRLRNLERVDTIEELFQVHWYTRVQTKKLLIYACRTAGQRERALLIAEELLRNALLSSSDQIRLIDQLAWMRLEERDPKRALELVDSWLFERPSSLRKDFYPLFLNRARIHVALGELAQAHKDLKDYFQSVPADMPANQGDLVEAYLIKGFVCEDDNDRKGALAAWREGYRNLKAARSTNLLGVAMLGSLSSEMTESDARQIIDHVLGEVSPSLPFFSTIRGAIFPFGDVMRTMQEMWRTPRGRKYARRITLHEASLSEATNIQVLLWSAEFVRQGAFPGTLSAEDDALIWQCVNDLSDAYQSGRFAESQVPQFYLTWMGFTGSLGWPALAAKLEPRLRAELGYICARRYLKLNKPQDGVLLFRTVLNGTKPGEPLHQMARRALDQLGR